MSLIVKILANCILTKGYSRGIIADVQRKNYFLVPNSLVDFVQEMEGQDKDEFLNSFRNSEDEIAIVNEYMDFLLEKEIIFFCYSREEYERFPHISMDWDYPAIITNAVVEVKTVDHVKRFLQFQNTFFIPYVQFVITTPIIEYPLLTNYLETMTQAPVKGIQILFANEAGITEEELQALINKYPLIESLYVFKSAYDKIIKSFSNTIVFSTQAEYGKKCCGSISSKYFNVEFGHIRESLHFNSCLNRKIAVDGDGLIRNCWAMPQDYGHVDSVTITDIVKTQEFQKYWGITKDQVTVCKDCEFRHICTDCRAYLENPDAVYSKPLKCGYNPYTCEWEKWSDHPLKQNAIAFYDL